VPFAKLGTEIWRDFNTAGVPASGAYWPPKIDVRAWTTEVEARLGVGAGSGTESIIFKPTSGSPPVDQAGLFRIIYRSATTAINLQAGGGLWFERNTAAAGDFSTNDWYEAYVINWNQTATSGRYSNSSVPIRDDIDWYRRGQNIGFISRNQLGGVRPPYVATLNGSGQVSIVRPVQYGGALSITIASPGVVTLANHGLLANRPVVISTNGALPTGLVANVTYYVRNPTTNTFQLSATSGGASINTSGSQSGVHVLHAHAEGYTPNRTDVKVVLDKDGVNVVNVTANTNAAGAITGINGLPAGVVGFFATAPLVVMEPLPPVGGAWLMDVGPAFRLIRDTPDVIPANGSIMGAIYFEGKNTAGGYNVYGGIACFVSDNADGITGQPGGIVYISTASNYTLNAGNSPRVGVGKGLFGATGGGGDKGINTANFDEYWVQGAYRSYANGSGWFLATQTSDPLIFGVANLERMRISSNGVGIGLAPAGPFDVNGHMRTVSAAAPTAGAGLEVGYEPSTHTGYLTVYNRTTSNPGTLQFFGSSVLITPGGTSGVVASGTVFYPFVNGGYNLGDSGHRWNQIWGANMDLSNTTASSSLTTGALVVAGDIQSGRDIYAAHLAMGASGAGYPCVGYNVQLGVTADVYTYRTTDFSSMLEFRSGGFNFNTAPSGSGAITYTNRFAISNSGVIFTTSAASFGGAVTATSFRIGSQPVLSVAGNYTSIFDPTGTNDALSLGNLSDPTNYYKNDIHNFYTRGAGTLIMQATTGQLKVYSTAASTSPTTGSIETDGGLGVAGHIFAGGQISADATSGFWLGSLKILGIASNYHALYEPGGNMCILLGGASALQNAYDNTTHLFRTRAGAAEILSMTSTGISFMPTDFYIKANTADASDNKRLLLCGGGLADATRGGFIYMMGNEYGTLPGCVVLVSGASAQIMSAGHFRPFTDNTHDLGITALRWTAVYAVNGAIQTSDVRQKCDIRQSVLGLDFILEQQPIVFKWKDGKWKDGKDERDHLGLPAQHVRETLLARNHDNVSLWVDGETQSLAMHQFIPPLIKAQQDHWKFSTRLSDELLALKGRVAEIERRLH